MSKIFINNTVYDDGKWSLVTCFLLEKRIDVIALTNISNVTVRVALVDTFIL